MKISSNKISDMLSHYFEALKDIYSREETAELCSLAFEYVYGWSKDEFIKRQNQRINQSELIIIYDIAEALAEHKPIQYIVGEAHFYSLKFYVNKDVLIPRQETEELVHLVLNEYKKELNKEIRILDIGTGSGCIPISIKKNAPQVKAHGIDVSGAALDVARHNANKNNTTVHLLREDILLINNFSGLTFDYIISNPPYIAKSESHTMQKNVLDNEPHIALFVEDNDPLIFYKKISKFASKNLNRGGKLFFEINQRFAKEVADLLYNDQFTNIEIVKDINNNERIVWATLS